MKNNEKCVKEASKKEAKETKTYGCTGKKFSKFTTYLKNSNKDVLNLTFTDIENILGEKLAPSHRKYKGDWCDTSTISLACSWVNAGFGISNVDMKNEKATFTRKSFLKENTK